MAENIITHGLPFILSAVTIYQLVLAGSLKRHAWAVMVGNQALWLVWIVATGTWGLLPMNIALWIVSVRNHLKWRGTLARPEGGAP